MFSSVAATLLGLGLGLVAAAAPAADPVSAGATAASDTGAPAGAVASTSRAATTKSAGELRSALVRTAIVVPDLAAARRFYVEGLGLRVRYEGDISRPAVLEQLNLEPGRTAYFVVLDTAGELKGATKRSSMIGLLAIGNPPLPRVERPHGSELAAGESMLAIETDDFRGVEARLRAMGARFLVEPMPAPDGSEIEMVVRDPAGTRVHVVERYRARP